MKRLLLSVATALSLTATAQQINFLTFRAIDGTETSIPLAQGIRITFSEGRLHAVVGEQTHAFSLNEMSSMWLSEMPTSVMTLEHNTEYAHGSMVSIHTLDGRLAARYIHGIDNAPSLPMGIYLFKNAGITHKKIVTP